MKQAERVRVQASAPLGSYAVELGVWSPSDYRHLRLGPWWRPARKGVLLWLEATPDRLVPRAPQ